MTDLVYFVVDGAPVGKARPRVTKTGHAYTPTRTKVAETDVKQAWQAAGRPRLPDGAVTLMVAVQVTRPKTHYTTRGALSATGRRAPLPTSRPDLDNVAKLVADALNGLAWRDDAQITDLHVIRRWGEVPRIIVFARPWTPGPPVMPLNVVPVTAGVA